MPESIVGDCIHYTRTNPGNTAEYYEYDVPGGLTRITAELWGAQGRSSFGGLGAHLKVRIPVVPGETLGVYVAGQPTGAAGGWPDGGRAGNASTNNGAGGGASQIWRLSDHTPLVLAAGGGGRIDDSVGGGAGVPGTPGLQGTWRNFPATTFQHRAGLGADVGSPGQGGIHTIGSPGTNDGVDGNDPAWDVGLGFPVNTGGHGGPTGSLVVAIAGAGGGGGWPGGGGAARDHGGGGGGMSNVADGVAILAAAANTRSGHGEIHICPVAHGGWHRRISFG